jgi:hypothetical protein
MMLVVADTSPFVALVKIGHIGVLPALYGSVTIPVEVTAELSSTARTQDVRAFIASTPPWLSIQAVSRFDTIPGLHVGEQAAINLAIELKADLLLIDDQTGRKAAIARKVQTVRTAALLFEAARIGVLGDLKGAFDRLKATNFRVPAKVLDELLKLHQSP